MGKELVHCLTNLHVKARLGRAVTYIDGGPTAVQILLDFRPATQNPNAPPLDLRFVIDVSGSMGEYMNPNHPSPVTKLDAVKTALDIVITEVTVKDSLSIVTFSENFEEVLPNTVMDSLGVKVARKAIADLKPMTGTHISGALKRALSAPVPNSDKETRVLLFTDGESTVFQELDHSNLVACSDTARSLDLPLNIYGTGVRYNWSLLEQMAIRAGNSSFLCHVIEPDFLREHMRAEIGFIRGVGVRGLVVEGVGNPGVYITRVTRFMPMQADIELPTEHNVFKDRSGSLDIARGQQYMIELLLPVPNNGHRELIWFSLNGQKIDERGGIFHEVMPVSADFTRDKSLESEIDPYVLKIQYMMVATRLARDGRFEESANLYSRAGDQVTATAMRRMATEVKTGQRQAQDARRYASTTGESSVSMRYTADGNYGGKES